MVFIKADMVELADTMDLGSIGHPCRFESCYPHQQNSGQFCSLFCLYLKAGRERERRRKAEGKRQVNLSFSATDRSDLQSKRMNLVEMLCKLQERVLLSAPTKRRAVLPVFLFILEKQDENGETHFKTT